MRIVQRRACIRCPGVASMTRSATPTAERILDVAETIFAERGYDATSLSDIAEGVGIRTPSLYNHFKNKENLYIAVLERLLDPFFEMLDGFLSQPLDATRGEEYIAAMMDHHAHAPNLARLLQHASLAGSRHVELLIDRWYRPFFNRAARLIGKSPALTGPASEDLPFVIVGFNNMILGYITMAALHAELLGGEPLSAEAIAGQSAFLRRMSRAFWESA
jgi:TetR/AcrR family transcriptional regulator